ncbi:MAG TPA: HAD family hydrolase [Verrucomicrobiae bacterium]|nr:HAD family hydrolase [Verrucomicrobiae bacterium]
MYGVGFDLDHTLAIDNKLERVAFLRLLELVPGRGGRAMGSLDEEGDRVDALLALQRSGAFSIDEAVRRFVRERGVAAAEPFVERFRALALEMAEDFVVPLPGVRETIGALRGRGFTIAVLSNGWNPLQTVKASRAGFDGPVIASADVGAQKPDARAFSALLEALGSRPEHTWYVGDDPHGDVSGASAAGLHPVWLDNQGHPFPPHLPQPAHRITSLEELLAVLPARAKPS